jgi:hypothetical protein
MTSKIIGLFLFGKNFVQRVLGIGTNLSIQKDYSPLFAMEILFLQKVTAISLIIL